MAELIVMLWRPKPDRPDQVPDPNRVDGKIDKSKWGGDGTRWSMARKHGVLVEVNQGSY